MQGGNFFSRINGLSGVGSPLNPNTTLLRRAKATSTKYSSGVRYRLLSFLGFPRYKVGTDGSVWRYKKKANTWMRLKPIRNKRRGKYTHVILWHKNKPKGFTIHKLVLLAFVGPRPHGKETRHLNGKGWDNRLSNLKYGTPEENAADKKQHRTHLVGEQCHRAKITWEQVREIRRLHATGDYSNSELSRMFSVGCMHSIIWNQTWKDPNYIPVKRDKKKAYAFMMGERGNRILKRQIRK